MIKDDGLRAYADLLEANGFAIYEPKSSTGSWFTYSRMVDGVECFGTVEKDQAPLARGYKHTMPIRPSVEHGSSMFVAGVPEELTVEAAEAVASPSNYNHLVGIQKNYREEQWLDRLYTKR